jgi:LacI family transcriptional regulator
MKDIADRGNVSLATVSRVLRDKGAERFSQATRDKVLRVATELGWSPNRLVRGIQTGRTGMVGLVMIPFGEHWQRLIIGLHTQLLTRDVLPLALYPEYNADSTVTEMELLRHLMELRVEGIACWPLMDRVAANYLANVCAMQVPVVTLDFELPGAANTVAVRTPERRAMAAALDHLVELGHERIGFVGRATLDDWAVDRRDAFVHQMATRRLQAVFVEEIDKGDSSALARLDSDLRQVTAVVAASEQLAFGVWHVASDAGMHIPQDLSIVGFGQFNFEFALWPRFTSIDQRPEEIGRVAAMLLVDSAARNHAMQKAADSASAVPHVEVEPVLVVGQTTAPPKAK